MTGPTYRQLAGPRIARGLPRPCEACGQAFRPVNNKGRFCSEACKKARRRLMAKAGEIGTPDSKVARVPFRSKSDNGINAVQSQNREARVAASTGWHIAAGELVFCPMPKTPPFTANERRRLSRRHMRVE